MILLMLTMNENRFRKSVINSFLKIVQYIKRLVTLLESVDKLLLQDCLEQIFAHFSVRNSTV